MGWDAVVSLGIAKTENPVFEAEDKTSSCWFLCNGICRWQFFIQSDFFFFLPIFYIKKKKYYHKAYPTPAEV